MSFGYMESEHRNSGKLFIQLYDALRKKMCGKGHKLAKNREYRNVELLRTDIRKNK